MRGLAMLTPLIFLYPIKLPPIIETQCFASLTLLNE